MMSMVVCLSVRMENASSCHQQDLMSIQTLILKITAIIGLVHWAMSPTPLLKVSTSLTRMAIALIGMKTIGDAKLGILFAQSQNKTNLYSTTKGSKVIHSKPSPLTVT